MISFSPSEEQALIVDTLKRFAKDRLRSIFREADENGELPADLLNKGWELGLVGSSIPEQYGGFGEFSAVTGALALEELAWGDLASALALSAPASFAFAVLAAGTEAQREALLPQFSEERFVNATSALIEPRLQFNPRKLQTTATRDGDGYVLNGVKSYVPLASSAEHFLIYAAEDGQTQAFIVPAKTAGLSVGEREKLMGVRALEVARVTLDNVNVAADAKLGGESGIDFGRVYARSQVALAALAIGVARGAYEYALDYARNRQTFGEAIGQRQSIAFMLAEMLVEIDGARLMVWEAAWKLDNNQDVTRDALMAKHNADKTVLMVCDRALQILGGHGYIREFPVELWLRNARGFTTFDGLAMV
ncbi:acyl-CoA dehydrogenase family protein [Herpetosiphon llansteffanensis]|uniref:acyl-CoA dehydrogenase family protein n=1 Tax=Herpetosiphon llansteffanensis TaxID=2094568 RepID=UPI000D7BE1D7|nr:acyl-CoA dehydrogenase family protein [Herpetosiphon llansteffanensis]